MLNRNHEFVTEGMCEGNAATGALPACAPLANPYVPFQQNDPQTYQAATGIIRGTMYPGLDLPFMGMVNQRELKGSPLHQLQALHFAIQELGLYLDTHGDDKDAVELFNQYVEQYEASLQKYENEHGPMYQMGSAINGSYQWTDGPWPWDYNAT